MNYKVYCARLIYSIMRRNLKNITLYTTNRCNSRCKTCSIWKKTPKKDLPLGIIKKLLSDDIVSNKTTFQITGGEILLHPQYKEILSMLSDYEYQFFSNGILADRLIEAVKEFEIKNLFISADGVDNRYKSIRGVDNFKNIRRIVRELDGLTSVTIDFTISPFNSKRDLTDIVSFCEDNNAKLIVGIYNRPDYFDTNENLKEAFGFDSIKSKCFYFPVYANNMFIRYYNEWLKGRLNLPCYSIRSLASVLPDGRVALCQGKSEIIGNLHKNTMSDIWYNEKTIESQRRNRNCNSCFLTCQRPYDLIISKTPLKWFID
ncbi:MAG: radical SAM protein [Candidatus Aenigmatarchaeota archaeon]